MSDIIRVGDAGVNTVEGQVSGNRAAELSKQREKEREEYEMAKAKIKEANNYSVSDISSKFKGTTSEVESEFRRRTVGLVSMDEFRKAREDVDKTVDQVAMLEEMKAKELSKKNTAALNRAQKRKKIASSLSFAEEADEDDGEEVFIPIKKKKNPNVDTSHLPDAERDQKKEEERQRLRAEWMAEQDKVRQDKLEVVYSWWDGSGHRKEILVTKGTTIGEFLQKIKVTIQGEFRELKSATADQLMYVKEDLIIPHHCSFFDLIITKARGKSGPLFHFDVHDDVRLTNDARIEKDESHPGKVVGRWWYEKNKHIFPASRWEHYDADAKRDAPYTIHDTKPR